ncbi:MAG: hypothetical protein KGL40_05580 [Rhodocyclaceae bacterium]|nr:hypothetical protein [Rhodocyclaceae bacterium]
MRLMRLRFQTLFRYFLLLCVVLNLGDAPYFDEIMEENSQPIHVSMADSPQESKAAPQDIDHPALAHHGGYENLLANVPLPTREMSFVLRQTSQEAPQAVAFHLPSPPSNRLERPPRQTQTA